MDVQKKALKNGLVVASEVMPHLRSASLGIWVKCGSRYEGAGEIGISHFIEHLLFKGTKTRSASKIAEAIDSVGGQLNAFTEKEYVGFYAKVLDEHLPFAFELLSDIVLNPIFPAQEIERERSVIFEEIKMVEDSPQELILDVYQENFWKDHSLGKPISGTEKSVAGITRADVKKFFKTNYNASNTIVSVAGNVKHQQVFKLAERYFSKLEKGSGIVLGEAPRISRGKLVRNKTHLEQSHLCLGTAAPPVSSEDRYAANLLCNVLGGGLSSRLFQNIREKRGLAYSVFSMLNLYHDTGSLIVYAGCAHEKTSEVLSLIVKELKKIKAQLVPSDELKRAKENIKGSVMLGLESSSSRMTHLAQQLIYYDRFYELEGILKAIDRVSSKDVRELANKILDNASLMLTALTGKNGNELKSMTLEL
jgi:predicted Zn-dependent peptidase